MSLRQNSISKRTWRIQPELDVQDLQPPVILFSLFDSDPRLKFKEILHSGSVNTKSSDQEHTPSVNPQGIQQYRISAMWDFLFHDIPGDRVYFLYHNPQVKETAKSKRGKNQTVVVGARTIIASDDQPGTKWIATRALKNNSKFICWCIPVTVTMGKVSKVRFTSKNMMMLSAD